jgi:hypothetical protein
LTQSLSSTCLNVPLISCNLSSTFGPVYAVILLIPLATASWFMITNDQISFVFETCVHPQNSIDSLSQNDLKYSILSSFFISSGNSLFITWTTRTMSQYFSSKNIFAHNLLASAIGNSSTFTSQAK